ncbi:MAG: YjjG family noncanonical pyrimidine nucleotidase [Bacteroidaceae bacterium]|nr:YjjG family noncanonical pyrimidine nucleotidase [Bacteroidaceae bacterium]
MGKQTDGIKAVFMDVDDTLLDFNECARENIRECFRRNGLEYSEHVFDFFLARNIRLWKRIEDGLLTVDELHRTRWAGIFRDLGIDADGPSFEQDFIAGLRETHVPVANAQEILEYLHRRYMVYVVSNASNAQQSSRLGKAGLMRYVDGVFGSLDIGINKPSRGYFDYCFSQMGGITPAETVIIGDSLNADIKGGSEYGLHTIWFNIRNIEPSPTIVPDFTVYSLTEIKSIL